LYVHPFVEVTGDHHIFLLRSQRGRKREGRRVEGEGRRERKREGRREEGGKEGEEEGGEESEGGEEGRKEGEVTSDHHVFLLRGKWRGGERGT
jgi:hypothetical protein